MAATINEERKQDPVEMVEDASATDGIRPAESTNNADSTNISIFEAIKADPKVIMYCILVTTGPLMYGFDSIIVGLVTAMPSFQHSYGELLSGSYIIPAVWLALWNAFVQLGVMFGADINGPLADRFGRKIPFITGGLFAVVAVVVFYMSDRSDSVSSRRGAFLAGKTVLGIGLGMLISTCQTYISEITPTRLRGPLLSIFTFVMVVGQLIAVSIVYARIAIPTPAAYRVTFASQWAFAGFAVFVGLVIPESPSYLLKKGKIDQACRAYRRLHSADTVDSGIAILAATLENENDLHQVVQKTSYMEIFRGTNWRRTRIIFYANTLQLTLGITLLSNSTYFLELGGLSPHNSLMITELAIGLSLPANVISWFAMTTIGRRAILLLSTGIVGTLWLGIGIAGCYPESSKALWFIGIMMVIVLFFYDVGIGGACPVVGAETSSVRLRAQSQGFGFLINGFWSWAFNFFVPYMFDVGEADLGGKMGFFFFGLCVISFIVVYIEVPEMKNRTYAELDEMFEKRLPTRLFSTYVCENAITRVADEKGDGV